MEAEAAQKEDEELDQQDVDQVGASRGCRVRVRRHGLGILQGEGCCGRPGLMHVKYDDGTEYHCQREQVEKVHDRTGKEIYLCEGCDEFHAFGEEPGPQEKCQSSSHGGTLPR